MNLVSTRLVEYGKDQQLSNVSIVLEMSPPITTVANGRCTSAPEPVETAIGMKPRLATKAVMSTGRKRLIPLLAPHDGPLRPRLSGY
jgi:hypothetical protein